MATNHTTNHALNLWEPTDAFLREEFNENFDKIDAAIAVCGNCKIVFGDYWGDGLCGNDHPNVLTFDGTPLMVFVSGQNSQFTAVYGSSHASHVSYRGCTSSVNLTWGVNSLSWHMSPVEYQMNTNNGHYFYVALIATK